MTQTTLKRLSLALTLCWAAPSMAQSPTLEEVLVTAQKREQSLRDVPISVNTLSGDKLDAAGNTGVERMADYIPNFNMTQTGIGTTISIRGISSGVNQGFEQSAAMFVDGVHFGRAQLSRAPLLDIERVEVLRGPQSILFGKNSTAGAISITSASPTDEFMAELSALYAPEHGERDWRAIVSGPLNDQLQGRLAILDRRMDGYMYNATLERDEAYEEDRVMRAMLAWQPNENWDVSLKLEDASFDRQGRNIEAIHPATIDLPGRPTLAYSQVLAALSAQLSGGARVYQLDTEQDFVRQSNGDFSFNDSQHGILNIETQLGELNLTSVTGYNSYNYEELCDCDFIGVPLIDILSQEDYSQWSQELRLASPLDQKLSYLGGVFFQSSELDFADAIGIPQGSFLPPALTASVGPGAMLLENSSSNRDFAQQTDIAALFGQFTWSLKDDLRLVIGGRFTEEDKTASRRQFHSANGVERPVAGPTDPYNGLFGLFNIEPYETISDSRRESSFTPSIILQYDLNSTDMVYASYTTGFKSGGFDVRSNSHPDPAVQNAYNAVSGTPSPITGVFEFDDEEVKNFELGGKFSLAGGAAELNLALFQSEFTDLQTSQFDGAFSFNVTNAAAATTRGLELDGRWLITETLSLNGGLAWLDFEYDQFPTAQCYFGQAPGQAQCDASGKTREFTPEWQGNLSLNHIVQLADMKLGSTLDLIYSDDYLTSPTLDPRMRQESYLKINARLALSGPSERWELALIGSNLTDEAIVSYANGLPVATVMTQGTGTAYYAFYERPRSLALQGTLRF